MNRLQRHLSELKSRDEKAAIVFITAGDPSLQESLDIMLCMAENGADCIELGIPFSDPIADGPVIQRSTARALKNDVKIKEIFELVKAFRKSSDVPIVLMGYYNPLYRYGLEKMAADCSLAGVDGLIIADLPFEEGEELQTITRKEDVSLIYLLAPDIDPMRTRSIVDSSSGFIYCVAQYSTTGTNEKTDAVSNETIELLKKMTNMPVVVGFGISDLDKAREISKVADGVIVGSWLLKKLETADNKPEYAGRFVRNLKKAMV
jgi:tryptophan synthase alpha chain